MGNARSVGTSAAFFRKKKMGERETIIKERGLAVGTRVTLDHGEVGVIAEITPDYSIRIRGMRGLFHPRVVRRT